MNGKFVSSANVTSFHKPKHHGPFPADVHQPIQHKARLLVLVLLDNVNCQSIIKDHYTYHYHQELLSSICSLAEHFVEKHFSSHTAVKTIKASSIILTEQPELTMELSCSIKCDGSAYVKCDALRLLESSLSRTRDFFGP